MEEIEDIQTLKENEQYLFEYCQHLANAVKDPEKWEAFKDMVGDDLASQLLNIIDEGPDPHF